MPKSEVRMLNGYRLIYEPGYSKSMTSNNWKGYIYEHILVAEKSLGRELKEGEVVHHLDGNRSNNRHENLLVLELGQHSKLHAWLDSGASWSKAQAKNGMNSGKSKVTEPAYCQACGRTLQGKQKKYCSTECCSNERRTTVRPTKKELAEDLKSMSYLAVGRKYSVSDNAIRKWAKAYELL